MRPVFSRSAKVLACLLASTADLWAQAVPSIDQNGSGGQPEIGGTPANSGQPAFQGTPDQGNASIQSSLGPYGDPGGVRAALAQRGVTYSLAAIGNILGNPVGGVAREAVVEGRLDLQVNLDLKTAIGLDGATLHANGYEIDGRGLDLGVLSVASGIEAAPSSRLYEAWYEQSLFGGQAALRLGQLGADTEFLVSQYAVLFTNATYGWPNITSYDLPSGGPAYPLAAPGLRLKLAPDAHWSLLAAVFDGDPAGVDRAAAGGRAVDSQALDRHGTNFRVTDPPLAIAEAAWAYGQKDGAVLPGLLKLGGWRHFGRFARETGADALPSSGMGAGRLSGNDGVYGMVDQMVYRVKDTPDGAIGVFARLSGSPADRNLVSFYADAGVTGKGLVPGRPDDTMGLAVAFTQVSPVARDADRALGLALGAPYPLRSNETLIEATYQAEVVPGFSVQPDLQYVIRPGGNVPDPRGPAFAPIRDAAIVGLIATIQY